MDGHIAETELSLMAVAPDELPVARQVEIERHTAGCSECRATLDFFSVLQNELQDGHLWERVNGSATLDALRAHAERIAAEDEEADELLKPLLASAATAAMTNILTLGRRYVTGGVVRRLNAHAHSICESEPLEALTYADAAISVAEALPENAYPAKAVYELRGTAWKERANALMLLGEHQEALESLTRAERAYEELTSSGLGLASVALVRAGVLYDQQRLDEAATIAQEAETGFQHLGDDERRMSALFLRASIQYEAHDVNGAAELFERVVHTGDELGLAVWTARGSYALGNCEVERGDLGAASMRFHAALTIFREAGPAVDRVRTEWGIARVLLQAGKREDALHRLREIEGEYETRGMVTDAALVGLDMSDALLALGRMNVIVELASRLFGVFKKHGMITGALSALAYLKEASAAGRLTPAGVQTVRAFLRRAERQPEMVFVPPPEAPR